jgi:hypothetical protein
MRPALDPAGHRVPRTKPTCLLHTWRPHRRRPFALVLHLHQHQSSRNLHLQYLAKNQSTQCCQSLITQGSNHPPVLEPHMVLNTICCRSSIMGCCNRSWDRLQLWIEKHHMKNSNTRCPASLGGEDQRYLKTPPPASQSCHTILKTRRSRPCQHMLIHGKYQMHYCWHKYTIIPIRRFR